MVTQQGGCESIPYLQGDMKLAFESKTIAQMMVMQIFSYASMVIVILSLLYGGIRILQITRII